MSSEPWNKKNPKKSHKHLSPQQKGAATKAAHKGGRTHPSLVDNMNAAKKKD